jgi:hypothetical protein
MIVHSNLYIENDVVLRDFSQNEIKNEPMLFSCDVLHARSLGGIITNTVLDYLSDLYSSKSDLYFSKNMIIDTRVHMLQKGWYPCIPGWHMDDVPRDTLNGQPNLLSPLNTTVHVMVLLNGDIASTEFAVGSFDVPPTSKEIFYDEINSIVENDSNKRVVSVPSNRFIFFDHDSIHRGVPAVANGWRFFFRATAQSTRQVQNQVRRQTQVYLDTKTQTGW